MTLYNSAAPIGALERQPTAREAVEAMLRGSADAYADPDTPRGCMVVLAATNTSPANERVRELLADLPERDRAAVLACLERGIRDGNLPATADVDALAAFYLTVLHGLSMQARDGCSRSTMHKIIDSAMSPWDAVAFGPRSA